MNRELLHKLIDLIVAEVVRRVAVAMRQAQHPEDVAVLLAAPIAYPKELKKLLNTQFGDGFTPICFTGKSELEDDTTVYAADLSEAELTERIAKAKTVILVAPRLELLKEVAEGRDESLLSYLMVRSILWRKDVRLYIDFEPPKFRRNTFLEGVASSIDTLREMSVGVYPYFTGDAAKKIGASLVTEADVLAAAQRADKTICCCVGAIITPAARDALLTNDVIVQYEGEEVCS